MGLIGDKEMKYYYGSNISDSHSSPNNIVLTKVGNLSTFWDADLFYTVRGLNHLANMNEGECRINVPCYYLRPAILQKGSFIKILLTKSDFCPDKIY